MSEMYLAIRSDGSAYLAHHGVKGMRWGVRHDPEPSGSGMRSAGSDGTVASRGDNKQKVKIKKQKRKDRVYTINGKTYNESFMTAHSRKQADKYSRKSETGSVARNIANVQTALGYKGKAEYYHKRDVGRTMGTKVSGISTTALKVGATAVSAVCVAAGSEIVLAAAPVALISAGANYLTKRREYKRGADIISGRKKGVPA